MSTVAELLRSPGAVGRWELDPARSTFAFRNKTMWGLMTVKGQFREFSGEGQIADGGAISGRIDIATASLHTGIRRRDEHLRSADFFDVEKYPEMTAVVSAANPADGDTADIGADINIKGIRYPLPLRARVAVLDDGAVQVSVHISVDREQLGVSGNLLGMVAATTHLSADAVFCLQRRRP